jgi:hypothetical protein
MHEDVLGHLAYKIANAPVAPFPMPHIYVENVFPSKFYNELTASLPLADGYMGVEGKYKGRKFHETDDMSFMEPLRSQNWVEIATFPFRTHIGKKWGTSPKCSSDLRLVLDGENYSIGPHTDAKYKILSFLFYLPNVTTTEDLGTSIYLPNDPTFRCEGGPHYPHADFTEIYRAPFRANSLFAFFKTNFSFHGVNPITIPCRRDVLLWNLYGST